MSYIVVDVEADGPIPHKYSMVCFGAVIAEPSMSKTFYGQVRPIATDWIPDALAVSGFSRQDHENFEDPLAVIIFIISQGKTLSAFPVAGSGTCIAG
jgi:hypothetical protein